MFAAVVPAGRLLRSNWNSPVLPGALDGPSGPTAMVPRADGRSQGDRRAGEKRLEAAAHAGLRELGRRGAGTIGVDGIGRGPCRRTSKQGGAVRQLRYEQPR